MLFRMIVEHEVLDEATDAASVKVQVLRASRAPVAGAAWIRGSRDARTASASILKKDRFNDL